MNTTGGSVALLTSRPSKSAEVIERVSRCTVQPHCEEYPKKVQILGAGMIIIGKAQLSVSTTLNWLYLPYLTYRLPGTRWVQVRN